MQSQSVSVRNSVQWEDKKWFLKLEQQTFFPTLPFRV